MTEPALKRAKLDIAQDIVNQIRVFAADMVQKANSGHPGAPMGMAPMAYILYQLMKFSPSNPDWMNRDRFVLSNGHACALQYTMLHLYGFKQMTLEQCMSFRQLGSVTPGHPENFVTDGVELSTGPLGQGISNAVGMAIGESHMAATYNTEDIKLIDHCTYVFCGDGCLQEGISSEACSLAGHLGLGKLIVLYDDNKITIDGSTDLSFTEDVAKRYESYNWQVIQLQADVATSEGLSALNDAIEEARANTSQPSFIQIKTVIGYGSKKEGTAGTHGAPLGDEDVAACKAKFGLDPEKKFHITEAVAQFFKEDAEHKEEVASDWEKTYTAYKEKYPEKATELERRIKGELPTGVLDKLPNFEFGVDKDKATRQFSQACLNSVAADLPELIGGSADLSPSNLTILKCTTDYQKDSPAGRYLRFGVREHGMAAICNGLSAYGGFRPFCATFLNFVGYALGAIRVSALSKFGVIYIMTHDSIGLGEDGPTHQPVEMLESIRSMPNILCIRPADSNETSAAYTVALERKETPSVICLSRQTLKALQGSSVENFRKGAYVLSDPEGAKLTLVGSGSETALCVDAAKALSAEGIPTRVVSMPCQELFLEQDQAYQRSVFGNTPCLSVEASAVHGWHRFSHAQIGMTRFGASAPAKDLFEKFGFTADNVTNKGRALVQFYEGKAVPNLLDRPEI